MVRRKEMLLRLCAEYLAYSESSAEHALSTSDWEHFLEVANNHGICPLLYHHLAKSEKYLPLQILEHLKEQYYLNTLRNAFFYDELGRILGALGEAKIEVVVMKGAALAETIYLERGLRPFSDIDLLIRRNNLKKAEDTLIRLGYTLDICATPRGFSKRFDYHLRYIKGSSIVELHWDLGLRAGFYKYITMKAGAIWKDTRISKVAGIDALIPSPEDLIIHSCIHSAKHKYSRLIWLYDIRQIAEHHQIDWEYLIRSTKSGRAARSVFYGLYLADELLGSTIPKRVRDELKPPILEVSLLKFFIYLEPPGMLKVAKDMILRLLLIDRQIDRLKLLATYPAESLAYLLLGSKKRTFRRLKEGTIGL